MRVMLVEDDPELRVLLREALELEGYAVSVAASSADARQLWAHAAHAGPAFDVVLLDQGLPDGEGADLMTLFAARRGARHLPVLVISARSQDAQKIGLLDAGADDYLVKPFSIGELLARLRVALRRAGTTVDAARHRYAHAGVTIDLAARTVIRDGAAVHLTPREFALLALLVRHAGQVVTHRRLLADVWGADCVAHTHYLRVYLAQLRAKLEADPADPRLLLTEPGVGYRLATPSP